MNLTGTPPILPLPESVNRCLAHGEMKNEWCERRYQCACHETIKYDRGLKTATAYRKCTTDLYAAYIPLEGFQPCEEEEEGRPA